MSNPPFGSQGPSIPDPAGDPGSLPGGGGAGFGAEAQAALQSIQAPPSAGADGLLGPGALSVPLPNPPSLPGAGTGAAPASGTPVAASYAKGIDVSQAQGAVNWQTVANAGFSFAYVKATESSQRVDGLFSANWAALAGGPLLRGAYHSFDTAKSPLDQALLFGKTLGSLLPTDLPPVLDFSAAAADGLSPEARVAAVLNWLQLVSDSLGRKPIVRTTAAFLASAAGGGGQLAAFKLWIIDTPSDGPNNQYQASNPPPSSGPRLPPGWGAWTLWQYSGQGLLTGAVAGSKLVNFDAFQGSKNGMAGL